MWIADLVALVLVEAQGWVKELAACPWVAKGAEGERFPRRPGPEQLSTCSASTVTVQEATPGVPATILSQRSSTASIRLTRRPFSS